NCDRWLELLPGGKSRISGAPYPSRRRHPGRRSAARDARHPAAQAWAQIGESLLNLQAVVPIERRHVSFRKSKVFRLQGVGAGGSDVIAKQCRRQYAQLERTIYERVLPKLSLPYPRLLGIANDEDGALCWLFMEDAGDAAYSPLDRDHRTSAAHWLGALHASTTSLASDVSLPDRGPAHYLGHLQTAKDTIRDNLNNPALDDEQRGKLERI